VRVTEDIQHREAFLFVPYSAMMSIDDAKSHPALKDFYGNHPNLFEKPSLDWEQSTLTCYLLYEKQKGAESKFAAYLDLMPEVTFFCDSPIEVIQSTFDPQLVGECLGYKQELEETYKKISKIMKIYPEIFTEASCEKKTFLSMYAQVCTRCFGWGLPSTSMIPMADTLNHSDANITNELISKAKHLEADEDSGYFTKIKYMNDYSPMFSADEQTPDVKGRFSHKNFEANKIYESAAMFKELSATRQIWQIPYLRDPFHEDNDTDEEDEEEDDEESDEETEEFKAQVQVFLKKADYDVGDHGVKKSDLRKVLQGGGLDFYIKKEKDAIKKTGAVEQECGQYSPVDEIHVNNNEYLAATGDR